MKTLYLVLILTVLGSFCSCQQNSTLPEDQKQIVLNDKSALLIEGDNEFGLEVFQRVRSISDEENLMISPLSVSLALAMTYNGADGDTKAEMEQTLKLSGLTPKEINESYKMLVDALQSLDEDVVFRVANAIFYANTLNVKQDFINTNKNYYDAEVEGLDFTSPASVDRINNWVAGKTNDKINKIIDKLSPLDRMVLLNAIYFNGIWTTKFKEDGTLPLNFRKNDGSNIEVPMMNKEDKLEYTSNDLFEAIKLPYGDGQYQMTVLLPTSNKSSQDLIDNLSTENWKNWMNEFKMEDKVVVTMPRFKYEFKIKLNELLMSMGMPSAFDPARSDFSGIADISDLHISSVMHKTFIDVNENGTEAAAVTSVVIGVTSIDPDANKKIYFTVDRPFVFAITEKDTDAILFIGEVRYPEYEE